MKLKRKKRKIVLIKAYSGDYIMVDNDDYSFVNNLVKRFGLSVDKWGYPKINYKKHGKTNTIKLHRLIMRLHGYPVEGLHVDHRDRNKLNNSKSNLRVVGYRMNNRNRSNVINY